MKNEDNLEPTAVFIQRVTAAVVELKEHLQHDYERTYPGLSEIIRDILDEEETKAWELSFFPHLFLPDMLEAHITNLSRSREGFTKALSRSPQVKVHLTPGPMRERDSHGRVSSQTR